MRVRQFPADKLCDLCRARIAAMKTNDELALLKVLCAECEGAVAGADRPPDAIGWSMKDGEEPRWIRRGKPGGAA